MEKELKNNLSLINVDEMKVLFLKYGVIVGFLILIVTATILYPGFLSTTNIMNMYSQLAIVGVMSIGMTFVLLTGGLDMSVGGIYASSAVLYAIFANSMPIGVAMITTVVCGVAAGAFNGLLITRFRVTAFIATLGTGSIFTGIALLVSNANPIFVQKEGFKWLGSGGLVGLPVSVILLFTLYIIAGIVLAFTVYGRSIYAVGGNPEASRLSGLKVKLLTSSTYIISGACASIAGLIIASRLGQGQANIGETITLDVIAAVVIGGTSLAGGQGAIWRTVVGGSVLIALSNIFDSMALSPYWQSIFTGVIIIAAVMFDFYTRSKLSKIGKA
ncbi:ABC transporter permease [Halobacillus litoralis]|uniref:ABC transporter permease n=1 Tax=Halobacillus litoralis TaxID=45668 RepID=UPI002491B0D4|nr:ABC transporter permease [Halobacillus litoralis]